LEFRRVLFRSRGAGARNNHPGASPSGSHTRLVQSQVRTHPQTQSDLREKGERRGARTAEFPLQQAQILIPAIKFLLFHSRWKHCSSTTLFSKKPSSK